ncbi:hypothetical protein VHUM_02121 [Vanrija humicola]|uniref:Uncharacterized protein n=1 Tax=Vanrija humicola TaxID=5417 RepID=A0A7D8YZU1_VANHU|nr:hypothetical protein VHUM_02121 [Vanrija humicola]
MATRRPRQRASNRTTQPPRAVTAPTDWQWNPHPRPRRRSSTPSCSSASRSGPPPTPGGRRWSPASSVRALPPPPAALTPDPGAYSHIALVAGAQVYLPPKQRALLRAAEAEDTRAEKTNPYLPAYMSPRPASFGQEYRAVGRQLATVLNVLFSVFGLGGAAYVVATTGAGWTRSQGLLLAVFAGAVVAVADVGLIWIFSARIKKDRRAASIKSIRTNKGSGRAPGTEATVLELEGEEVKEAEGEADTYDTSPAPVDLIPAPKATVRLRRRALGER